MIEVKISKVKRKSVEKVILSDRIQEKLQKHYSQKYDEDILKFIAVSDPESKHTLQKVANDGMKKTTVKVIEYTGPFTRWVLGSVQDMNSVIRSIERIKESYTLWSLMKNNLPERDRDLLAFKKALAFNRKIKKYSMNPNYMTASLERKLILLLGIEILYEDEETIVYYPRTKKAAIYLGRGASWCTGYDSTARTHYESYSNEFTRLAVICKKGHGTNAKYLTKHQISIGHAHMYCNKHNEIIPIRLDLEKFACWNENGLEEGLTLKGFLMLFGKIQSSLPEDTSSITMSDKFNYIGILPESSYGITMSHFIVFASMVSQSDEMVLKSIKRLLLHNASATEIDPGHAQAIASLFYMYKKEKPIASNKFDSLLDITNLGAELAIMDAKNKNVSKSLYLYDAIIDNYHNGISVKDQIEAINSNALKYIVPVNTLRMNVQSKEQIGLLYEMVKQWNGNKRFVEAGDKTLEVTLNSQGLTYGTLNKGREFRNIHITSLSYPDDIVTDKLPCENLILNIVGQHVSKIEGDNVTKFRKLSIKTKSKNQSYRTVTLKQLDRSIIFEKYVFDMNFKCEHFIYFSSGSFMHIEKVNKDDIVCLNSPTVQKEVVCVVFRQGELNPNRSTTLTSVLEQHYETFFKAIMPDLKRIRIMCYALELPQKLFYYEQFVNRGRVLEVQYQRPSFLMQIVDRDIYGIENPHNDNNPETFMKLISDYHINIK